MKKMSRVLPLVALVALVAAIPASTQVVSGGEAVEETANLPMLIAVNRMELTQDQMVQIHSILQGLLDGSETQGEALADLQDEMIAFQGTAEELDAILEAHRAQAMENAEAQHEAFTDAIDQIKGILTLKQGEALSGALGGLLGGTTGTAIEGRGHGGVTMRGRAMMPGAGATYRPLGEADADGSIAIAGREIEMTEEMEARLDGLKERFGDRADTLLEGLKTRMSESFGVANRFVRMQGMMGTRQTAGGGRIAIQGMRMSGGQGRTNLIQQLVDVLELKLQAIE